MFALIYDNLPHHFYHSTIKQEQILHNDNERVRKTIKESITETFVQIHETEKKNVDKWTVNIDELEILYFRMEDDLVKFAFSLPLEETDEGYEESPAYPRLFNAEVSLSLIYIPVTGSEDDVFYGSYLRPIKVIELTDPPIFKSATLRDNVVRVMFPRGTNSNDEDYKIIMLVHLNLLERLVRYSNGQNGLASDLDENYWRMLYLSAVTITTLGYGDIVPITNTSRILISMESILGIVLIGLFLNALAYERQEIIPAERA